MRFLIVSDTHGRHRKFEIALEEAGDVDAVFHLGDIVGEEEYFENACECPVFMVAGNNDFWSDLPFEQEVEFAGKRIFMTHGHEYHVHSGICDIVSEGVKRGADIVMFGHTHVPFVEEQEGMMLLNPGSLTYPRQTNHKASYLILDMSDGKMETKVKYI